MKQRITPEEALAKLTMFCASRERSHHEVRSKLLGMHIYGDALEDIISRLIAEGYLNEERFARAYVSGKFRISKWGRTKIMFGLRAQHVADYCINKGLEEIDEAEYEQTLRALVRKHLKDASSFSERQKTVAAMQRKGFETELILRILKERENAKE